MVLGGRAPIADFRESLPRASKSTATSSSVLFPGARAVFVGHVDCGSPSDRDGFTFVAAESCRVRFRLTPTLPGTDLELDVRERAGAPGEERACGIETTETAHAGERLDLCVRSAWGSSSYRLEIEVGPIAPR
jgi:hypothetical protein